MQKRLAECPLFGGPLTPKLAQVRSLSEVTFDCAVALGIEDQPPAASISLLFFGLLHVRVCVCVCWLRGAELNQ